MGQVSPSIQRLLDGIIQPTLAVLPFVNMSRNEDLDYFCEGLTESLITDLSRSARLSVASRNSSFSVRDSGANAREIAERLGVRFLIEGSVQSMGQRMRVNVQLIDAGTDEHVWAERYERAMDDLFEVQDELCDLILVEVDTMIAAGDASRVRVAGTTVPEARRLALRCAIYLAQNDEEGLLKCQEAADKAHEIEPTSAGAMQMAAFSRIRRATNGWAPKAETIEEALDLASRVDAAGGVPGTRQMLEGTAMLALGEFQRAVDLCQEGVETAPSIANARIQYARTLNTIGEFGQARSEAINGVAAHPNIFPVFLVPLGLSLLLTERFGDAIAIFNKFRELSPKENRDAMFLAASLIAAGKTVDARRVCSEILDVFPGLTISEVLYPHPFRDNEHPEKLRGYLKRLELPV